MIRVGIYYAQSEQSWAHEWKHALRDGIRAAGDVADLVDHSRYAEGYDVTVTWGVRGGRRGLMARQNSNGGRHLVMERGYLGNREHWTSLGLDGLNGRAEFPMIDDPSRFDEHFGHLLQSWKQGSGYALIMGQVKGDCSVLNVDLDQWYRDARKRLESKGWEVRFRPHPLCVVGDNRSLEEDLSGAELAVTFNSNSGVDAALAGVPVHAEDEGSMALPVASREYSVIRPNRSQWAARLAWYQWTMDEIARGEAWMRLREIVARKTAAA